MAEHLDSPVTRQLHALGVNYETIEIPLDPDKKPVQSLEELLAGQNRSPSQIVRSLVFRTATAADLERCLAVLTLAFSSDPACRWAWPDSQQYLEAFPRFVRAFGGGAIDLGTAYYTENFAGVALWLPPGVVPDEVSLARVIQDRVAAERKDAMFSMFEQMDAYHPGEPHWHLPLIGVDPMSQDRGIGSTLQRHILEQCDRQQALVYLEATSSRNVPFYERHGFEALGIIQVADSPPIVPMLRKPR